VELDRLDALATRHGHISGEEITALRQERSALAAALGTARLRIDALRVAVVR